MSSRALQSTATQLRRAFEFLHPSRARIVTILGLSLVAAVAGGLEPLILKYILDGLGGAGAPRVLMLGVIALIAANVIREFLGGVVNWLSWRVRLRVNETLLDATVGRIHSLPLQFHRQEGVGSLMTRLDRSIAGFVGALSELFNLVPALAYLVLSVTVMLRVDWRLALVALAFAPVPALIGAMAAPEQMERERRLLDRWARLYSRFNEVLAGIVTVKSFVMEEEEKRRFLRGVAEANVLVDRGVARDSAVAGVRNMVSTLARVAVVAAGGLLVVRGEATVGTVVAFLGYVGGLFGPVQGLTGSYQNVRRASVSLDVILSILDAHDQLGDAPDARELAHVRGDVRFERVSFGYNERQPLLHELTLDVGAGETVALVGPSGGGKTTLMALLQRLYDPGAGRILIDGQDLRTLRQRSLRTQIGVVLQDALLFDDTVRNNIAYGRPDATFPEIAAAAAAANADAFIRALPRGYDTMVGERGGRLSAGERQRIAIARALIKDPPILILDEATSALDAESESLVQEAVERLVRGRTTFLIAHRLSTVTGADRIVVLKDGRVHEMGRHEQLLDSGGYYSSLIRRQLRGMLPAVA